MRRTTAMATAMALGTLLLAACGVDDGGAPDDGDGKADRVTKAVDRGDIEPGTSRRARFTEPGQSHAFRIRVAAGAVLGIGAYPIASAEKTLKTTLDLYGPVSETGSVPRQAMSSTKDGTFKMGIKLDAAGEYRIVVATATSKMVGTYDLDVECANHACSPEPVTLAKKTLPAAVTKVADDVECTDVSWCTADLFGYTYEGERPSLPALTEAVLKNLSRGDEDWFALDVLDSTKLGEKLASVKADKLLAAARDFAGARDVEGVFVDGDVQIPIDDSGTDGFDQDVTILHFPTTKTVVALLVKH